jgi:hypothetical protein
MPLPPRILTLLPLLLLLLLPQGASARAKTDVIQLYNGDHITGEIVEIRDGILYLSTDAMGTAEIEWKHVAEVKSGYNFELRLVDGDRVYGSLATGERPGTLELSDVFGERTIDNLELIELRPIETNIADRFDLYASANFSFTQASGVSQTELQIDSGYEDESGRTGVTARSTVTNTDEEATSSARLQLSRQTWTKHPKVFRWFNGGYESNDELRLKHRYTAGGGFGRFISEDPNGNLRGSLGAQVLDEQGFSGTRTESVEGVINLRWSRWRFVSPELDLEFSTSLYPSLTEGGRRRADVDLRLRWEIISDLFWDVSTWATYDNDTEDDVQSEYDWGITTGIGWSY